MSRPKPPLPPHLLEFARDLRRSQTTAEDLLWNLLRNRGLFDIKFRRQHPVETYIVDFYCESVKLGVELDGGQHNSADGRRHDEHRARALAGMGIDIVRFWNSEVFLDTEAVLNGIWRALYDRGAPVPSPYRDVSMSDSNAVARSPSPPAPLPEGEGEKGSPDTMSAIWRPALTLNDRMQPVAGSALELREAIARGADLRIYSEFRHDEHIDVDSSDDDLVQETMDMRATYLVDGRWAAGIITLRQPVALPDSFGPRPSLSLFLYNEDGSQAIARPHLDGPPADASLGPSPVGDHSRMPRYVEHDRWDDGTNAPSSNFTYAFDTLRYYVREDWRLVLHHSANGEVLAGSHEELADEFARGVEWKVGISGLCDDFASDGAALPHQVFIQCGSCYLYTRGKRLVGATHPVARVRPGVPLRYQSGNWDYAWLVARTDGHVARLSYDPYSLRPTRANGRHEIRWFCR